MFYELLWIFLTLNFFFDVLWFLRFLITVKVLRYPKKSSLTDKITLYGIKICSKHVWTVFHFFSSGISLPKDVDWKLQHLTSGYLRELDFAKFHYYKSIGLYEHILQVKRAGGSSFQGASFIKVFHQMKVFTPFKIESQILGWDDNSIYLRQTISTFSDKSCCCVFSKQRFTKVNANDLIGILSNDIKPPNGIAELKFWMKSMKLSSEKLRRKS